MDNDPIMTRCCIEAAVITIGFAVGWFVFDWIRGTVEYRREMQGEMRVSPVIILIIAWCLSMVLVTCLGIWVNN